jgi:hypothetical protein
MITGSSTWASLIESDCYRHDIIVESSKKVLMEDSMRSELRLSACIPLLFFVVPVSYVSLFVPGTARAQLVCDTTHIKEAEGEIGLDFDFVLEFDNGVSFPFVITTGTPNHSRQTEETSLTYMELDNPGWELVDVTCESNAGSIVTFVENGVNIVCDDVGGEATCVWTNVRATANIPTLSEWGMIAAAGGLALVGVWFAVRRRKAQAV